MKTHRLFFPCLLLLSLPLAKRCADGCLLGALSAKGYRKCQDAHAHPGRREWWVGAATTIHRPIQGIEIWRRAEPPLRGNPDWPRLAGAKTPIVPDEYWDGMVLKIGYVSNTYVGKNSGRWQGRTWRRNHSV